jgi:hypothetical protein
VEATVPVASPSEPSISANEQERRFLADMGSAGSRFSKRVVLSMGQRACGALAEGSEPEALRQPMLNFGVTEAESSRVLLAAVATMCPEFGEKVNP